MRKILLFCVVLFSTITFAQEFNQMRLVSNNRATIIKNATFDTSSNQITYLDEYGDKAQLNLTDFEQVQYKKGSHWLAGMLGGMGGSILGSMIAGGSDDQEWWYGIAPKFLIGGGLGAAIGALFPKYTNLDVGEKVQVEVGLNSVKITF